MPTDPPVRRTRRWQNRALRWLWDHVNLGPLATPVAKRIEQTGGFW